MFKPKSDMVKEVLASLKAKSKSEPSEEKEYSMEEASEKGSDAGLEAAAEDILSAMQSKDPASLAEALKAFFDQC